MLANMGAPEEERHRIAMKSEFLYSKFLTTPNMKQYAGLAVVREGVSLDPPDLDIKGLAIKKVGVAKSTREFFQQILREDILTHRLDLAGVLRKIEALKKRIRDSLLSGKMEYSVPKNHRSESDYKFPWSIDSHRGVFAWNLLMPDETLPDHEKINFLKMRCPRKEDAANALGSKASLLDPLYDHPECRKFGFTALAVPKNRDSIPEWLAAAVDVDAAVQSNISSFMPVLEAIGFRVLNDDRGHKQISRYVSL